MNLNYEHIATGRTTSMFAEDIKSNSDKLMKEIKGSRIAVIGAAGSIGSSVVREILNFFPKEIVLFDLSENNLVEVVRDLRSSKDVVLPDLFSTLPIGLGSLEFLHFFQDHEQFDYVFNLCAMKHVRSEKDVYCIKRMVDTNILYIDEFLSNINYKLKKFFSVSSDKAVSPANVMGASKLAMEQILLSHSNKQPFSTARFANVAFSDGSLPFSYFKRIEKSQPIVAPSDIKRYFMSHEEAGQLCLLSAILGDNGEVFFPKMSENLNEKNFMEIATSLITELGYTPHNCSSEDEAKNIADTIIPQKKWPCFFSPSNTSGEKAFEEFFNDESDVNWDKFENIGVIKQECDSEILKKVDHFLKFAKQSKKMTVKKEDYINHFSNLVSGFKHNETNKNLDQKM